MVKPEMEKLTLDKLELKRLAHRFKKLDLDGSGSLTREEFMSLEGLNQNPLVERVIDLFDKDGNGHINFHEFIEGLSQFSVKSNKQTKLKFAFSIYDVDKDGFISNCELFKILKVMVGNNLNDDQLQQIVDKTIIFHDKDGDGKLSFDEFCQESVDWSVVMCVAKFVPPTSQLTNPPLFLQLQL